VLLPERIQVPVPALFSAVLPVLFGYHSGNFTRAHRGPLQGERLHTVAGGREVAREFQCAGAGLIQGRAAGGAGEVDHPVAGFMAAPV
jgi:hypothetical protein